MGEELKRGDYVLATKWHDGSPHDHFCVGFYDEPIYYTGGGVRHRVVDAEGNYFRYNGFRRVENISKARGEFILNNLEAINQGSKSLWWWKRTKKGD